MSFYPNLRFVKVNHQYNCSDFDLRKSLLKAIPKGCWRKIKSDLKTRPDALAKEEMYSHEMIS